MKKKNIKKKILVIDDDPEILDSIKIVLEMQRYKVIPLLHADRISWEIRNQKPSLILLDIWLSGDKDGLEIARFIKSKKEFRHIPVILISAISNMETVMKSSYADDFLAKPFEIDDVIKKVSKYS